MEYYKDVLGKRGYHQLIVCDKAKQLIKEVYAATGQFPPSEVFGLSSQTRRATVSVLLNIVEGQRRNSAKDFLRFLDIADGSLAEVEACLDIAKTLHYLSLEQYETIELKRREVAVMLVSLKKAIKRRQAP